MATTYLLDDMADWLGADPTVNVTYVPTVNLIEGLLPDLPDVAASLFEPPGGPDQYTMGPGTLPAFSQPSLQVITRGTQDDYMGPRQGIEAITRSLEGVCNTTINGTLYMRVARLAAPGFLHRDATRRVFFVCNFDVQQVPS
jgi:hypothetical protein